MSAMELPAKIKEFANAVATAGGRAMLVGGCVRDRLSGIEPKDWDLEVYRLAPETLRGIVGQFGRVNAVGEAFTVYKIGHEIDVSIPRRERKTGRGHRGFTVEGDPSMSFADAARRRDFTINAMLEDVLTGEIVDCYGGREDLENRVIRMVSPETFGEDSLRVLRAAQFAARFEFSISPETAEFCRTIALDDLPSERIWGELIKILLLAKRPSIGLLAFDELNVTPQLFPELAALKGVPQDPEWHPEGDVDVHTRMVCDEARKLIDDLPDEKKVTVMLGALCHDLGKPSTTEFIDGRIRSRGHQEAGVEPTNSLLARLGVFTLNGYDVRSQVVKLVQFHLIPGMFYKNPPGVGAFRRLAAKVELDLLYRVAKADALGRTPDWLPAEKFPDAAAQEWFIGKVRELGVERQAPDAILLGRNLIELGLKPSPLFKRILREVYERQLDGEIGSLAEAMAAVREILNDGTAKE